MDALYAELDEDSSELDDSEDEGAFKVSVADEDDMMQSIRDARARKKKDKEDNEDQNRDESYFSGSDSYSDSSRSSGSSGSSRSGSSRSGSSRSGSSVASSRSGDSLLDADDLSHSHSDSHSDSYSDRSESD